MDVSCQKCGQILGYTYQGQDGESICGWWHAIDSGKLISKDLDVDHAPIPVTYQIIRDWRWNFGAEPVRDVHVERLYILHREGPLAICLDQRGKLTQEETSTLYASELDALFSYYKACEFTAEQNPLTPIRESALEHIEVVCRALKERGWERNSEGKWIEVSP